MEEILRCEKISKVFVVKDFLGINKRKVKALQDVSITLNKRIDLGIVGESGSGKTTLAKVLLLLVRPDSGSVYYRNTDLTSLPDSKLRFFRNNVRIIFQNPYKSLNPRLSVEKTIKEALFPKKTDPGMIEEILIQTGLPADYKHKYPHQMSGGERQRVAIARAIAGSPECIIADEPTGNLDATTEVHILKLLDGLKKTLGLTFLFITHNLKIVVSFCETIVIMYRGCIVEQASATQILKYPLHPYTRVLWNQSSFINPVEEYKDREGCVFLFGCPYRKKICFNLQPELKEKEKQHMVSCFLYE
ncbi:MAG: ABC transporter ATP-binding protein [Candidatus Omnitrophica bacterium]|nr:ABC transporter ATP-binding protein [Candidatus Omnitrophota bacterium]MCM8824675.1 ABC transporter ATP-binding protein [Candidatus Omnitrophota bacterium]